MPYIPESKAIKKKNETKFQSKGEIFKEGSTLEIFSECLNET